MEHGRAEDSGCQCQLGQRSGRPWQPEPKKLYLLTKWVYSRSMDAWAQPLAFALLILVCVLMGLFGADSRPGFSDGRTDRKDRWFVHSKTDYR